MFRGYKQKQQLGVKVGIAFVILLISAVAVAHPPL